MINIYLDLKHVSNRQVKEINKFLQTIPKENKVNAIVDINRYNEKYIFPRVDNVFGTYGACQNADMFITFYKVYYPEISAIILNKNIFSVSISEQSVKSYVDLKIKNFDKAWERIHSSYLNTKTNKTIKNYCKRKKIAFVTPLNTDKSAIARYSYLTLSELCKKADVDVFSLEKYFENDFGANKISYLTPEPYITHKYDSIISVLGNSIYHNKMFDFHLKYGGNALVHDANVLSYSKFLYGKEYIPNVARFYNNVELTCEEKSKMYADFSNLKVSGIEPIIEASKIYYTHSKKQYDELKKRYNNIVYLPFCIYSNLDENKLNFNYKKEAKRC